MDHKWLLIFILPALPLIAATQDLDRIRTSGLTAGQKADTIFSFARKNFRKGMFDSVAYWLNKGQPFAEESRNAEIQARYYVERANLYFMQSKFRDGIDQVHRARPFLDKTDSYELHNSALLIAGNCFSSLESGDSALYYLHQCEEYNNLRFPYRNWLVYSAIGKLFSKAEDPSQAEGYFQKAYELTKNKEGKPDHGFMLTQFANHYAYYNKAEGFGKLLSEYNELMAERKKNNGSEPAHNLLFVTWTSNNLDNKIEFMNNVKESSFKNGNIQQAILANGYIINFYEKNKQFDEAIKYAEENEQLSERSGNLYNLYVSIKLKYNLLKRLGKHAEAIAVADKMMFVKDSMISLQRREQVNALEASFQNEKKIKEIALLTSKQELNDREIALLNSSKRLVALELLKETEERTALARENQLMDSIVNSEKAFSLSLTREKKKEAALNAALERENDLRANELRKEKKLRSILIIGTALLLLAGGIILFQYRRQRAKSVLIQKQADDLQVLMKEIHHRVKNNLQVISSLLDLQSMTIADNQASEAVKEGKNRVQSMALIHQNLYSEGNIKGIKAKEYIDSLLQSLCDSYNVTNEKVKIKTQIEDLNLDVDTMIPLGLVLNELVSNSLKYAFGEGKQGELSIILKEEKQHLLLRVSDNGRGYPAGINAKEGRSFGMKMIRAFAQKLKAKLEIYNNNGAVVEMEITKYKRA